jgi:hypothetical protein
VPWNGKELLTNYFPEKLTEHLAKILPVFSDKLICSYERFSKFSTLDVFLILQQSQFLLKGIKMSNIATICMQFSTVRCMCE